MNNIRNFCIIAHIDHGKSTLADRMLELTKTVEDKKMQNQVLDRMELERERGITIKLQPVRMNYEINGERYIFNLIDTPGHVDFSYEVSRSLAAVEGAILLVDATQGIQAQTLANLHLAQKQNLDIIPVINKIDMPAADVEKVSKEITEIINIDSEQIIKVSAKTGENVEKIFPEIIRKIRPPKIDEEKKLRALIFDSIYDDYRGVVAYVKIVDGQIKSGQKIGFMATGAEDVAGEVGFFSPDYVKKENLSSGEIGYIVTGLKNTSGAKVGDTITIKDSSKGQTIALSGYKKVTPMVFAGFFTKDGNINDLRDALEKLSLNDSALSFDPENSPTLGMGFNCGFLGLLHMEIIKERLLREYDIDPVITTPQVKYKKELIHGKTQYSEPWVILEIITPEKYIGPIMEITTKIRGTYLDTQYIGGRTVLQFEAPLANIVTNFYDRLKSVSSGYATMAYEFVEYREEDLVKLDFVLAGDIIESLSKVVHRNEAQFEANKMVKKLKDNLPQQMFKVSIQAAIGGKIIARQDLAALKKNVTAKLYGGDVSRKKKLWKKQKEGKKKMESLGKVEIPTDTFIKLIK